MLSQSFERVPLDLKLKPGEVHIWCASLDQPASRFNGFVHTLSMHDRMRGERFHFEQDRKRFMVGRGILRSILGRYLCVEPSQLQFSYGKNGKPRLVHTFGNGTIHFSLSHSEGIALYGIVRDRQIGVDIEQIRDIPEMHQIAQRFFSARENTTFRALPESKKKEAFFNCWTRKEAFVKAVGRGLSLPLDKFEVSVVPGEPAQLLRIERDPKEASRWYIQDLKPASGFAGAFAVEGQNSQFHRWRWSH